MPAGMTLWAAASGVLYLAMVSVEVSLPGLCIFNSSSVAVSQQVILLLLPQSLSAWHLCLNQGVQEHTSS